MSLRDKLRKKHTIAGLRKKYLTRPRRLHWFIALNGDSHPDIPYDDLAKVAIHTALENTALIPHIIYDGGETELTSWCRSRGVGIHRRRTPLYEDLRLYPDLSGNVVRLGSGAFLRLEVPGIARELNLKDETVLYTDVDVMFLSDPCPLLSTLRPPTFAVALEMAAYDAMNSGVMLMNIRALQEAASDFMHHTRAHLATFVNQGWDQDAYATYYKGNWQQFPMEYNWKPYWGWNPEAKIVHFHGPKPSQREALQAPGGPVHLSPIRKLANAPGSAYHRYCLIWDAALARSS
jgi:hypothetical protein